MIIVKTVKIKLETEVSVIMPTVKAYIEAFNYVCSVGWKDSDYNAVSLHKKTYQHCKSLLPSQLTCSSRNKAVEALRSVKTKISKGGKASCPMSNRASVRYDANSYNIWAENKIVSISTISGRKKFNFTAPPTFSQYLDWRRKSAELFIKGGKVFLGVVFEKEVTDTKQTDVVIGIDRGIKKIAVTSNNKFFGGGKVKRIVNRYRNLRKVLQSNGSKSAKRHLRKISKRENRFRQDVNHVISKRIVETIPVGSTLVLEDLKNIRLSSKKFRKEQRYMINGWSFYQLESFLKYKAQSKGCFVDFVDARYTSQKCSKCGHTEKGNRQSQSIFKCKSCGCSLNADLNAARNISKNHKDAKGYLCGVAVNQPIVARIYP